MMNIIHKIKIIFLQSFSLLLIAGSLFLFSDCKRTSEDMELLGTEYASAPANFYVSSGLTATWAAKPIGINFISDEVKFNASFSHTVTWTLTITGPQSGAVRTITGLSNSISNEVWKGQSSNIYFFQKGDTAVAVLSFLGSSITYSDTIPVRKVFDYSVNTVINGVNHILLDDFDGLVVGRNMVGQYKDAGDGSSNLLGVSEIRVQGKYGFHFSGTDYNSNSWLSGINTDPIDTIIRSNPGGLVTVSDPSQLYFNIYVYGTGKESSSIQLKAYELDIPSTAAYDQTVNDGYVYDIFIDWTGWKLISARYSEFKKANDPILGGNGNGIKEPQKFCGMSIGLNSNPLPAKEVEAYIDFLILTEGGRFIP